jgi:DNA-directed RNA polymerase specialized sigma24 family protein
MGALRKNGQESEHYEQDKSVYRKRVEQGYCTDYKKLYFMAYYTVKSKLRTEYLLQQVLYEAIHGKEEKDIIGFLRETMGEKIRHILACRQKLAPAEANKRDNLLQILETSFPMTHLEELLDKYLPPYDRMLFSLFYLREWEIVDICSKLHVSAFSMRNRLDELRNTLEDIVRKRLR